MFKSKVMLSFCFLMAFLVLCSGNILAQGEGRIDLDFTVMETGDWNPAFGGNIAFGLEGSPSLEVGGNWEQDQFTFVNVYSSIGVDFDFLGETTNTYLQAGAGYYECLPSNVEEWGGLLGARFRNNFSDNFSAFTRINALVNNTEIIPMYEFGFEYHYTEETSFKLLYRSFDNDRAGITLGLAYDFSM